MPFQKKRAPARKQKKRTVAPRKKRAARARVSRPYAPRKVMGISGGLTETSMSAGSRKRMGRGLVRLGAPAFYQITNGYDLVSQVPATLAPGLGRQCPVTLAQWNSVADVYQLSGNVPKINTIAGDTPTLFHLHGLKGVVTMNNPTSSTMFVDIYDICSRRDVPTSAATGAVHVVATPMTAWGTGLVQQANSPLAYDARAQLGALPTDTQLFNDYYKIVSSRSVVLPQNATHVHNVVLKLDKSFDLGEIEVQTQYMSAIKNFSYFTVAIVRGQPCLETESNQTSTISPALRWVVSEHYEYSWVQANGRLNTFQNSIPIGSFGSEKVVLLNTPNTGPVVGV